VAGGGDGDTPNPKGGVSGTMPEQDRLLKGLDRVLTEMSRESEQDSNSWNTRARS
jgi:hypothetical protein